MKKAMDRNFGSEDFQSLRCHLLSLGFHPSSAGIYLAETYQLYSFLCKLASTI